VAEGVEQLAQLHSARLMRAMKISTTTIEGASPI
jgi:hypothetical protein